MPLSQYKIKSFIKYLNINFFPLNKILIDYFLLNILSNMSIKKINGYKILLHEQLGRGAYGAVYKGQKDGSKSPCAIKIIDKKNINSDPYLKSALFSEIQILGKLNSQNIVKLFDVMQSSHNYYIVQQLCDNDLQKYLKSQPKNVLNEASARAILVEICNGFLALVREGIVHRDIKPANILIKEGKIKIADFGFAKQNIHRKVKIQSSVGTPLYMSVQILKGQLYTSKCDIWAIGCIFYQMLHGQTPWRAKSQYDLVTNIINKPVKIDQTLSAQTIDFIEKILKPFEADRICWDDIFRHQIFEGYFDSYLAENKEFENKYKKVMGDLRFKVNSQNIDIKLLWRNLGFNEDKDINLKQFQKFVNAINPKMTKGELSYFFQKMDANGDGALTINQIQQELKKFGISLTSRHKEDVRPMIKRTLSLNKAFDEEDTKQPQMDEELERKIQHCFKKLNKILQGKKLTLYQTFVAYDSDKNGQLTIDEFSKILKRLDPSFKAQQLQAVFNLVDTDGSKTVQFDELNLYYCRINCIPESMDLPVQYIAEREEKATAYYQQKKKAN